MKRLILILVVLSTAFAQEAVSTSRPDPAALLRLGREFTASLKLDQQTDAGLFRSVGLPHAQEMLMAVIAHGQERDATSEDWAGLHRATHGMVELCLERGETLKASVFASFQDAFYRNFEHDYQAALEAAQLSLDLHRKSKLTGNLDVSWAAVARDYLSLGKPEDALKCFEEARRVTAEPARKQSAYHWRDLIYALIAMKRIDDADREAQRFLDAARTAPPTFKAEAHMARSDVLMEQGRYDAVLDAIKAARNAVEGDADAMQSFEFEDVNQLLSCILASQRTLAYADAMALAKRIDREFPGLPVNISAFAQQSMQVRRRLAGEVDAVLREQTAALEQAKAAGSATAQIEILQQIAATYRASNSVRNQITTLEEALDLEKKLLGPGGQPSNWADAYAYFRILNSAGDAYLDVREIGKARRSFDQVTKTVEAMTNAALQKQSASLYGEAVLGKARVAQLDDDADTARDLIVSALAPKSGGLGRYARHDVLLQAARLERDLGEKPRDAAKYYDSAIETFEEQRDRNNAIAVRLEYAHFLSTHANSVPDALRIAAEQTKQAAREAALINFADAQWRVDYESGVIAEAQGDVRSAVEHYRTATTALEGMRAALSEQDQRESLLDRDTVQDLYRRLIALLGTAGNESDAWRYIERAKARSFVEMLHGRRFRVAANTPALAQLTSLEKHIVDLRVELSPVNEKVLRGARKEPAILKTELQRAQAEFALARDQAQLKTTRVGQTLAIDPVSIDDVRRLLPPAAALIEYALLNGKVAAFVVTRGASRELTWKADTAQLRKTILRLRTLLSDETSGTELKRLIAAVSAALVAPVTKALPDTTQRLVIVPAGVLNYLPFQVLTAADGTPLIDRFAITYLPNASSLNFLRDRSKAPDDVFLGALGKVSVEGWAPLPGTLQETNEIAKIYPQAARASERAFTHDQAKRALERHAVVHFATHGVLDEQAPLFSALLTGPAAGQPSRLSLYELTDIPLRARLVVLSACETGLGKLLGGDEVASLTRTFLVAGANTVVSSLWKVSDDATALLMQGFYKRVRAGAAPGDALRESSLQVRKKFPHPFFWAPFVVTGVQ